MAPRHKPFLIITLLACTAVAPSPPVDAQHETFTLPGGPVYRFVEASGKGPTGPPQSGVALALFPLMRWLRVGEPLWVGVEVRNVSGSGDELAVAGLNPYSYDITVTRNATNAIMPPAPNYQNRWDAYRVALGTLPLHRGFSTFGAIRVDRLVPIAEPGLYTVRIVLRIPEIFMVGGVTKAVRATTLESNALTINVLRARPSNPFPADERGISEGAVGTAAIGKAVDGFALSLSADPFDRHRVGVVEMRNISNGPHQVTLDSRKAYRFSIKDLRTGETIVAPLNRENALPPSPWSGDLLFPDTSLYASFDLQKMYHLRGDRYRATVIAEPTIDGRAVTLVSNSVEFTVNPQKATVPLKRPLASVLGITLQSSRPVYVIGEPVLLRAALTNEANDPMLIWGLSSALDATHTARDGNVTKQACSLWVPFAVYRPWSFDVPPASARAFLNFRYNSPWQRDFSSMGCSFDEPGTYTLVGKLSVNGIINAFVANYRLDPAGVVTSSPLTIRVITKSDAETLRATTLADSGENVSIRSLLLEYHSLRTPVLNAIAHVERGETQRQVLAATGNDWGTPMHAFKERVDAVKGLGDPTSAYVNVAANLSEAAWHLWKSASDAHDQCDPVAARAEIKAADYFAATVESEIAGGKATVGDAADAPPSPAPRGGLCHW